MIPVVTIKQINYRYCDVNKFIIERYDRVHLTSYVSGFTSLMTFSNSYTLNFVDGKMCADFYYSMDMSRILSES